MAAAASTASRPFFLLRKHERSVMAAVSTSDGEPSPASGKKKTVDTRIHWSDPEEGWVGARDKKEAKKKKEPLGRSFSDIVSNTYDSHYQFLGIEAEADIEEIKAAYRKLSKEYHPDTTRLPLKSASEKFIRLRQVYDVLSKEESRRFYDWTLSQEAESRRVQQLRSRLEDPYQVDIQTYKPVPDTVDRLGGRNMELSDQAMSALTFDIAIFIFSACSIVYAIFFKDQ